MVQEETQDQKPIQDNSFQYVNPYKFAYGVGAATLVLGFALGITRSGGKNQVKNRSAMQTALGAFAVGTALCGSSAYLISRGVMKAMDVDNMQDFARKLKGEAAPRLEPYRPNAFARGEAEIPKVEGPLNVWNWDFWAKPQPNEQTTEQANNQDQQD